MTKQLVYSKDITIDNLFVGLKYISLTISGRIYKTPRSFLGWTLKPKYSYTLSVPYIDNPYFDGEYEVKKIKDNLIVGQEEGCFIIPSDNGHFLEGWWIEEIEEFIEQQKYYPPSVDGRVSDLNNEEKVFYEVDGQLKQFIIHEVD